MKTTTTQSLITAAVTACTLITSSHAATILVDYDDGVAGGGHDASVRGGDFTSANAGGWAYDVGTNVSEFKTNQSSGVGSSGNLTIGAAETTGNTKVPGVDTGATISLGDTFDLSFMWKDTTGGDGWNDATDLVSLVLFTTTDNTIYSTATDVLTFTGALSQSNGTWQTDAGNGLAYNGSEVAGKTLFARIDTNASANEFARLDNVYVAVTAVPEPSSTALLGLGGLALILRRRR